MQLSLCDGLFSLTLSVSLCVSLSLAGMDPVSVWFTAVANWIRSKPSGGTGLGESTSLSLSLSLSLSRARARASIQARACSS
eukprot:COSAG03_NODE_1162_length_4683_cov_24.182810_7_plen_82_part_00